MPSVSVAANLLAGLKNAGFALPNGGLDPKAMTGALLDKFGEPFLRQVGAGGWCDRLGRRPNHVLSASVIDGRAVPAVLRALLLARLVTDDIASLWSAAAPEPVQKRDYQPVGYGRRSRVNSTHFEEEVIVSAIEAADGKIPYLVPNPSDGRVVDRWAAPARDHHLMGWNRHRLPRRLSGRYESCQYSPAQPLTNVVGEGVHLHRFILH